MNLQVLPGSGVEVAIHTGRVVNVSPSLLADVITCESKAWARHTRGYTSKGDAIKAVAGQAFHAAVAAFLDPENPCTSAEGPLLAFHRVYDPAYARIAPDKLEPGLTPQNLHRVVGRWIEMHPPSLQPWRKVLAVEEAFCSRTWTIGNTLVRLLVRPDAIVEDGCGGVLYMDTKTTSWRIADAGWRLKMKLSLQMALYADAVAQRFPAQAILGGWLNAVELRKLPDDPNRTCAEHKTKYAECGNDHAKAEMVYCPTTHERIERALLDAENAARQYLLMLDEHDTATLNMHGSANEACKFCPVGAWCDAGRVAEALPSFLIHEPWLIEEGKRAA